MRRGATYAVLLILLTTGAFAYGFLANERRLPPYGVAKSLYDKIRDARRALFGPREKQKPSGRWRPVEASGAKGPLTQEQQEEVERLASLGYASGSKSAGGSSGIVRHDPERAWEGLNFVVSGHAPEAFVMDMLGNVLHRWRCDFSTAFPDVDVPPTAEPAQFWRRARLFQGGDVLAIFEGRGLIRVDRSSKLVWAFPGSAHHDLALAEDGTIWVLTRQVRFLDRIHKKRPVLEDFVSVLDAGGNELRKISVLEAFERSPYASLLAGMPTAGDLLHTNSIEILDGAHAQRLAAFQRGNLLISLHTIDAIAVLDPNRGQIVWALAGMWKKQHEPELLANGRMLLFDNQGHQGMSKVIEFDPLRQEIVWAYEGSADNGFYTELCGASQRLPNGNTLITESERGRAFEVTPEKSIVWEYLSPYRVGERQELVATLLDVQRLGPETPLAWISRSSSK